MPSVKDGRPTRSSRRAATPDDLGAVVPRGVPPCLDPSPSLSIPKEASGRLQLARWLTESPPRALTARVMVNRIWQHHFGKPIVPTPSDFGLRGTPPTHPELLDWLAQAFIDSGWSIKAMHRTIMLSKTYRLAARPTRPMRDTTRATPGTGDPTAARSMPRRFGIRCSTWPDDSTGPGPVPIRSHPNARGITRPTTSSRRSIPPIIAAST